jgi:hypothetical protein
MTLVRSLGVVVILTACPVIFGQAAPRDQVISGNANLSSLSKEAGSSELAEDLKTVLKSSHVNVVIIQDRVRPNSATADEYVILYAISRETTFREMKITKTDYDWLVGLARRLNQI